MNGGRVSLTGRPSDVARSEREGSKPTQVPPATPPLPSNDAPTYKSKDASPVASSGEKFVIPPYKGQKSEPTHQRQSSKIPLPPKQHERKHSVIMTKDSSNVTSITALDSLSEVCFFSVMMILLDEGGEEGILWVFS